MDAHVKKGGGRAEKNKIGEQMTSYKKVLAAFSELNPNHVVHQSTLNEIFYLAAHPEKELCKSPPYPGELLRYPISRKLIKPKGQPRKKPQFRIAMILADEYWRATGKRPTVTTNPYSNKASGIFFRFLQKVFNALGIKDSAESMARDAKDVFIRRIILQDAPDFARKAASKVTRKHADPKAMTRAYMREIRKYYKAKHKVK